MAKTKSGKTKSSASVMSSDYSRCVQEYFCVQMNVRTGTWSRMETSDLKVTAARCWQLGGPTANLRDTYNPWKICDARARNPSGGRSALDGPSGSGGQSETCPSHFLPSSTCALSCGHPVFCVSLCHYSTCCPACSDPTRDGLCRC